MTDETLDMNRRLYLTVVDRIDRRVLTRAEWLAWRHWQRLRWNARTHRGRDLRMAHAMLYLRVSVATSDDVMRRLAAPMLTLAESFGRMGQTARAIADAMPSARGGA